jgi:release factor glutamine methyltransferase
MNTMRDRRKTKARKCFAGLRQQAAQIFSKAGIESAELDSRVLLCHAASIEPAELVARAEQEASGDLVETLDRLVERRLKGEPVARIVGRKEFWSHEFRLGPDTLVPRPDSETIVEAALAAKPDRHARLSVLDLGTGAGILLAAILLERPQARGFAIDRNEGALRVARANLKWLGLSARAAFVCGDWGSALGRKFDLVVSNPPYIESMLIRSLRPEVRDHDPAVALDGGPDGLHAYRVICTDLVRLLSDGGIAVLELGVGQQAAVSAIALAAGLIVNDVKSDLAGCPRALVLGTGQTKKTLGSSREPH